MQSKATSVEQYLSELPEDRRMALQAVREAILQHLPAGYAEGMQYGMIGYFVPHSRYPAGYHCDPRQPLPFGGLASQKNHMAVYLMGLYGSNAAEKSFRAAWAKTGQKLDMGKCCIRFKRLEDLPLHVLADTIAAMPVDQYIATYEAALGARGGKSSSQAHSKTTQSKTTQSKTTQSKTTQSKTTQSKATQARPQKSASAKASAKKPAVKKSAVTPASSKKSAPKSSRSK